MKRQDILEIIVSNPKAIFTNGNTVAGKYSEYPRWYQVVGMNIDNSKVNVRGVYLSQHEYLKTEDGSQYLTDEAGNWIEDTRPITERACVTYTNIQYMPTRLVLKSDKTEEGMLAEFIESWERVERERKKQEAERDLMHQHRNELADLLFSFGVIKDTKTITDKWFYRTLDISLDPSEIERLISVLKSALVEVEV